MKVVVLCQNKQTKHSNYVVQRCHFLPQFVFFFVVVQIPSIVQSPAFFPAERDRDAAVSNVRTWQSLGFTAQFIVGLSAPGNNFLQVCVFICTEMFRGMDSNHHTSLFTQLLLLRSSLPFDLNCRPCCWRHLCSLLCQASTA